MPSTCRRRLLRVQGRPAIISVNRRQLDVSEPTGKKQSCRVLQTFANFTGSHLCCSLVFKKVADLRSPVYNFIKKETQALVFPGELCKIFKNTYFVEQLRMTVPIYSATFSTYDVVNSFNKLPYFFVTLNYHSLFLFIFFIIFS